MPKKRKAIQISQEAFDELEKRKKETGFPFGKLIDSLTGLNDDLKPYGDQTLTGLAADLPKQKERLKVYKDLEKAIAEEFDVTDPKTFNTVKKNVEEVSSHQDATIADLESRIRQLIEMEANITGIETRRKSKPITKPDPAIIDAAILSNWRDPNDDREISRKRFFDAVKEKMIKGGWDALYPKWFKDHTKRHSSFEMTVDSRLRILGNVKFRNKTGIITRTDWNITNVEGNRGKYRLSKGLTTNDWQVVRGINLIKANSGFRSKSGIHSLLPD